MKAAKAVYDGLIGLFAWIAGIATVLMMIMVTVDVIGRNVFNHPVTGTVEIVSNYNMVILAFLPLALIAKERAHIVVELFTSWMSRRARTGLDACVAVVTFAYMAAFTWKAIDIAQSKTRIRDAKESGAGFIEVWPARWVVVAGFGLMTVVVLVILVRDFRAAWRDRGYDDGGDSSAHIRAALEEGETKL
ncbi:TRAP transporter small permease [Citreimonas salinaria]|uniref:TRAP transporter small permease protein n=1 Tax=Citreimonas salinaria TaxID=321339 RepID=A0A1H3LB32_9RHOB|nr:TRAP transporter small permease [Citreimonas salinaria]SDY61622.1 TRAP-type C4-dicarboxylate transport system, small permease component [Citreimonas salinaria]